MVAGLRRLGDRGRAARVKAGEEDGALDLRARDRGLVRNALQRRAVDRERRVAVDRLDPGAHPRQRLDDPPHRPARQRLVADEHGGRMGGRPARPPASASSCPSCRRRAALPGERQPPKPRPTIVTTSACWSHRRRPRRLQAGQRRPAVGARRVVREARPAVGQGREQRVAVRDGLVARHAQAAAHAPGGRSPSRRHGQHLTYFGLLATVAKLGLTSSGRDGMVFKGSMAGQRSLRLEFTSTFEMLDFVQVVSDHIGAGRRPRRRLGALGRRRHPRVGHQRHQARQPERLRQTGLRRVHDADAGAPRSTSASAIRARASTPSTSPIRWRRRTC